MLYAALRTVMPYLAPTAHEIRFLIRRHWQHQQDPARRAHADDEEFLSLKVQATLNLLRSLIRDGMEPLEAENRAMREIALVE